jgi:hypothetical protein
MGTGGIYTAFLEMKVSNRKGEVAMRKPSIWEVLFVSLLMLPSGCSDDGGPECERGTEGCECLAGDEPCSSYELLCQEGVCVSCDLGEQGCGCLPDETCTTPDMICKDGRCVSGLKPPPDPKCYTPCRQGLFRSDGTYVPCSSEGLMAGCLGGNECVDGSCVPAGTGGIVLYDACMSDTNCPDFQTCINGVCYSNCEDDTECDGGRKCHRHVCRIPCNTTDTPCQGTDRICVPDDGENGFCMPSMGPSGTAQNEVVGTFALSSRFLVFSNVKQSAEIYLSNESPLYATFKLKKKRHVEYRTDGQVVVTSDGGTPLHWLLFGEDGAAVRDMEVEVVLEPYQERKIVFAGATNGELSRWDGTIEVSQPNMGSRELNMSYVSKADGQWLGRMYYFASFSDEGIDEWLGGQPISVVKNAFLHRWQAFKDGTNNMTLDEFLACINSTLQGTWKWARIQEYPGCSGLGACYPYDNTQGYSRYTDNKEDYPIPTGMVEFPIAVNLKEDASAANLTGRIVSDVTLHYVGDPAVSIDLEMEPAQCTANTAGTVICKITGFQTLVLVGGRYQVPDPAGDTSCQTYAGESYALEKTPWLVPGFKLGTAIEDDRLYRYECRDTRLPFSDPGLLRLNPGYAVSNPIPDGRTRLRTITLVDGVLVNQEEILIIFKEHFESFMGADDVEGFSAYGLMRLARNAAELDSTAFEGNDVPETRTFDYNFQTGCGQELLDEIGDAVGVTYDLNDAAHLAALANVVVRGGPDPAGMTPLVDGSTDDLQEKVHFYCDETGLIDNYHPDFPSLTVPCPESSEVRYFTLRKLRAGVDATNTHVMEVAGTCAEQFQVGIIDYNIEIGTDSDGYADATDVYHDTVQVDVIEKAPCWTTVQNWMYQSEGIDPLNPPAGVDYYIRMDPVWRCADSTRVYCSEDRDNLKTGKQFFSQAATSQAVFVSAQAEVNDAFRYKTRFRSRTGQSIGFAPDICQLESNAIPYCYDPAAIEKLVERINCATWLYTYKSNDIGAVSQDTLDGLRSFLRTNYAYQMQELDAQGDLLPVPIIHEGFERLFSELLIMMGDEAYTAAFASRFDLAGSSLRSFEGELFEPEGINLSGGAGFEMYTLYQAVQYYQMALDRFYSLSPMIWRALNDFDKDHTFITKDTVTAYFDRLVRASTQKSRAQSEIAKRYQKFNRPDLARRVVQRAYTATYLESIVLSRMMLKMEAVVKLADWPQISERVEFAQTGYRSALLDMREVYDTLTNQETVFGYAPEYIPFPALQGYTANAFEKMLDMAKDKLAVAADKEVSALESGRDYNTDAASFQSELVSIRNNYENQLADLCGTFEAEDGRVYPAISKYAYLHPNLATFPMNPCGLVQNGEIHEAMAEVDLASLDIKIAQTALENKIAEIEIEQGRVETNCKLIAGTAQYIFDVDEDINGHKEQIRAAQIIKDTTHRIMSHAENIASLAKCSPLNGECAISTANSVILTAGYAAWETVFVGCEIGIALHEKEIDDLEAARSQWVLERDCHYARADSDALVRTMVLDLGSLRIEVLKALQRFKLTSSRVIKLYHQAQRLQDEQAETEQLSINVIAARNDPNVRIYKNDSVLTADRTFHEALRAAYMATKVYEYYTSQSYAPLIDLFLVRMVSHGDVTLESYLSELEAAFFDFEDQYGNPDTRVLVLSLRDDILEIPRYDDDNLPLSDAGRKTLMREKLADVNLLDDRGYITIPFATRLSELSPLTRVHKIHYIEAQILGSDLGDAVARVYLRTRGTGTVRGVDGEKDFYRFPDRTAVVNAVVGGEREFADQLVYRTERLRDRPMVNSHWELVINQRDEKCNQDIDLQSLDDILINVYYTDFTEL